MEQGVYRAFAVSLIREPDDPARQSIDPQSLGELADSIAAEGLHQPIGLVLDADGEGAVVAWGHRRLLAHRLLRAELIDAKVFSAGTDLALARWSENGQRADLNPMEEAGEVKRFLEKGYPLAQIRRMFRRSEGWVNDRLALLTLPADLQECVRNKSLALAVVAILRDIDHEGYRESLIREAIKNGTTAGAADVWRAHYAAERLRIISNHVTIEQLAQERQAFTITVSCEWCEQQTAVELTRIWRLCSGCYAEMATARKEAMSS